MGSSSSWLIDQSQFTMTVWYALVCIPAHRLFSVVFICCCCQISTAFSYSGNSFALHFHLLPSPVAVLQASPCSGTAAMILSFWCNNQGKNFTRYNRVLWVRCSCAPPVLTFSLNSSSLSISNSFSLSKKKKKKKKKKINIEMRCCKNARVDPV